MLEEALYAFLKGQGAVSALLGQRIYPVMLPQNPVMPALTYQIISRVPDYVLAGPSGLVAKRVQVNCWASREFSANGYITALNVAAAVRVAMDGYSGIWPGGFEILRSKLDNQHDDFEPEGQYDRTILDFIVHYHEN